MEDEIIQFKPDLITMDVTLPIYDGFYWTQRLRHQVTCPIIFLTTNDIQTDGVRALTLSAVDYIEKPFSMDYLIAKIQLILQANRSHDNPHHLKINGIDLNFMTNILTFNKQWTKLTPIETVIMRIL